MFDVSGKVRAVLAADGAFMALFTGGVFTDYFAATDKNPVNPEQTPSAYAVDAAGIPVLRPFALVREGPAAPEPLGRCEIDGFVHVDLYEPSGYETIRAGQPRAIALLDNRAFVTDSGKRFGLHWVDRAFASGTDPSLITGKDRPASREQLRFMAHIER